ncbi:hypothetical protein [Nocardiopsis suaedae]
MVPTVYGRKLNKVPYVELADGRVQGVVSSGSAGERVYVSSVSAGSHALSCATNNNRPCGGLGGRACKHIRSLIDEACRHYGAERVAAHLRTDAGKEAKDALADLHGPVEPGPTGVVFTRFLRYLSYLEHPGAAAPIPELHWFPAGRSN